jgi:hypothetical protein
VIPSGLFECCCSYKGVVILKRAKYFCNNVRKIIKFTCVMTDIINSRKISQVQSQNNSCFGITHIILVSTYIKQFWPDLWHRLSVYKFCGVNAIFK